MKKTPAYLVISRTELQAILRTMDSEGVKRDSQCVVLRGGILKHEGNLQLRWDGNIEIPSMQSKQIYVSMSLENSIPAPL